jgi:phage protein U
MANVTLMQWGPIQFQIFPLNLDRYDHFTGSDFARKDVLEAPPRREWVGEKDEEISVHGRVFPLNLGGFGHLEALDQARGTGLSHALVRGGGNFMQALGWFVVEELRRGHEHLSPDGVGRVIEFQARFARVDIPRGAEYYNSIFQITQGT